MINNEKKFPDGFLWGASTSAYQTEGGIENDWSEWERSEVRSKKLEVEGKNPKDYICGRACDSYHRWSDDIQLLKSLNCNAYRFGVEWARIEPEEGKFKMDEIKHYREILKTLKAGNIKTVLTIWHWTKKPWSIFCVLRN
jgi:beta-glucosidase